MLITASASACEFWYIGDILKVVNCEEYISLRAEPSASAKVLGRIPLETSAVIFLGQYDDEFVKIKYKDKIGYARLDYLENQFLVCDGCKSYRTLTDEDRYHIQKFLSNFSEVGLGKPAGVLVPGTMSDAALVEFALRHLRINRPDLLEWDGYSQGRNVRVAEETVERVVERYFGRSFDPESSGYDFIGGYCYWREEEEAAHGGFCILHSIQDMGEGRFRAGFCVYGVGMSYDDDVYRLDERSLVHEAPQYYQERSIYGDAVIDTRNGKLSDHSEWVLERWAIDWTD